MPHLLVAKLCLASVADLARGCAGVSVLIPQPDFRPFKNALGGCDLYFILVVPLRGVSLA